MVQKCIIAIFKKKVVVAFESTEVQNIKLELRMCKLLFSGEEAVMM